MLNVVATTASQPSPQFEQSKRRRRESNLAWLERHLRVLEEEEGARGRAYLVLLGGRAQADFLLRVAQGHLRHDMSPSHWSHVLLLRGSGRTAQGATWEISLEPAEGFGYPPSDNGVQNGYLKRYDSAHRYPNIAVLRLPIALRAMQDALQRFKKQRNSLDAVELILVWLGYVWGVGRAANPLVDGYGIPSGALVEALASAANYDLTPGLESRASCPEAIWQAAKWWHEWYSAGERQPHRGFWHAEHFLGQ
jgi:hypothetical protein